MGQQLTYRTTISQIGNSQGVRIPKYLLERELTFATESDERTQVELVPTGHGILIKPVKPKKTLTLEELFSDWSGPYEADELREWEQMPPVGRELL
ncbi:MAG: AbrB/MazE/SpoVT family DNA-binding domain-containing protein [Gracilibacteraceae bacterium]|jgi:antitoxin component of MazEF toxin-antitoxin module|nr:AbrB/MazE/SpoVT family DNA-binding domain-containing protein [Gracilibacteraceae bacterium]